MIKRIFPLIFIALSCAHADADANSGSKPVDPQKTTEAQKIQEGVLMPPKTRKKEFVERQLLVKFKETLKDKALVKAKTTLYTKYALKELQDLTHNLFLVELPTEKEVEGAAQIISKEDSVEYAEPNLKLQLFKEK